MASTIFSYDDLVPATRVKLNFGTGPSTAGAGTRRILLVGAKLDDGYATVNTVYRINKESDAEIYFGSGSPLHIAVRGALAAYRKAPLYCLPYAETSGGAETQADGEIVVSGTAIKSGRVTVTVGGEKRTVGFSAGDTESEIGDAIESALNAISHLPATGSNSSGTVTVTAKLAGASQGDGTTGVIRLRASCTPGTGITVTTSGTALGLNTGTAGADGSVTEAANLATALSKIENERYYYTGITDFSTASIASLESHIFTKSEPNPGHRSTGIVAFTGSAATAEAKALSINYERLQLVSQKNAEVHVAYLMGHWVAIKAKQEQADKAYNFDNSGSDGWAIPRVYDAEDFYSGDELESGVKNGVTLIQSSEYGSTVVRSVTTASKDDTGAVNDFRKLDSHIVSVADHVADVIQARHSLTYKNKRLANDVYLSDGVTIDPNQKVPPKTVTPSRYRAWISGQLSPFKDDGLIVKLADTKDSLDVEIDDAVKSRLNVEFDIFVIPLLHQTAITINEASAG